MTEKKQMTFEDAEATAAGQIAVLRFYQTDMGARFISNRHNATLIKNWLEKNGRTWTTENVTEAFLACESQMVEKEPEPPKAEPVPAPPHIGTDEEKYGPFATLTKEQVKAMSAQTMRKFWRDSRFVAKLNDLQIKRSEL